MLLVDDDRRYVNCNAAACEFIGLTKRQILAMRIEDLSAPELRDLAPSMFESFLSEGSQAGSYSLITRDGTVVNCSINRKDSRSLGRHGSQADPLGPNPAGGPLPLSRHRFGPAGRPTWT